nr:DNA circularization N-terminal domain-containing protein [uncultured Acinetobacter sp.]
MGWKDDLQDASFRGVQFECTSTNESGSKSLAVKQAPYSNKANVEDLGNNPLKISIEAIFSGENYKIEMDALWAALVATGSGELIHPVHGVMQVYAESYQIGHVAEEVDACKISIEFLQAEDKERPLFIPIAVPVSIPLYSIPDSPVTALQSVLKKLQQFNPNKFFSFVNKIRDGISAARQFLGTVKGAIENVLSPDWIVGLIDDATRLATFDTNISAISKWRDVFKRVQRFEKLFQNDDDTPKVMQQTWRAVQVATAVAVTQQVVATVRKEMAENKTVSFTPVELAVIRQANRKLIQQAINSERALIAAATAAQNNNAGITVEDDAPASELIFIAMTQIQVYKQLADQIHLQIQELIEVRPPITTTNVLVPCTLHWLAHALYGDMDRADEIRRLNPDLQNPAVLRTGMELTVYAR